MSRVEKNRKKNRKSYYKHRAKRLEKYREYDRTIKLQQKYGITPKQWESMYTVQNGCCAICGKHQSQQNRRLSVDHDHSTGKVRGLLCLSCNAKLGWFENNKNIIDIYLGSI